MVDAGNACQRRQVGRVFGNGPPGLFMVHLVDARDFSDEASPLLSGARLPTPRAGVRGPLLHGTTRPALAVPRREVFCDRLFCRLVRRGVEAAEAA